jgi:hypothetical protein
VRSSKARRLTRIRKGFYRPPLTGAPLSVAGLHWVGLLVCGLSGPPTVAAMQWWTRRGPHTTDHKTVMGQLLARTRQQWGRQVRHIWDRGFAGTPWLFQVLETDLRFVLRWPKRYKLLDPWGEPRKAWEIARGKRAWSSYDLYDPKRKEQRKASVLAISVTHPEHARPLWLVVARLKGSTEPWYLLTSDVIRTADDAWGVVRAYARRWQIDSAELALQQERARLRKSAGVDVGTAREVLADADAGVCVSAELTGTVARSTARGPSALGLSPHRKAEPRGRSSALPLARGP